MRGSLKEKYPDLAVQFHPILNGNLKPGKIHYKSSKQLFWYCSKCKRHWRATINQRVNNIKPCIKCVDKAAAYRIIGIKNKPLYQKWKRISQLRKEIVGHLDIFIKKEYAWRKNGIMARKKLKQLLDMNKKFRQEVLEERDGKKSENEKI